MGIEEHIERHMHDNFKNYFGFASLFKYACTSAIANGKLIASQIKAEEAEILDALTPSNQKTRDKINDLRMNELPVYAGMDLISPAEISHLRDWKVDWNGEFYSLSQIIFRHFKTNTYRMFKPAEQESNTNLMAVYFPEFDISISEDSFRQIFDFSRLMLFTDGKYSPRTLRFFSKSTIDSISSKPT